MATILLKRGLSSAVNTLELQTGELGATTDTGDLYLGTTTGKVKINGGGEAAAVTSVNGKTGAVTITKADVGLGSVDNTSDSNKSVLSATKLTTARTITLTGDTTGNVVFDGSTNVKMNTQISKIDGGSF